MLHYGGYLYFKNKEDFLNNTEPRDNNMFYFRGGYIKAMPKSFPITFKFEDAWDSHSCGNWIKSDEELLVSRLKNTIVDLSDAIVYIKKN